MPENEMSVACAKRPRKQLSITAGYGSAGQGHLIRHEVEQPAIIRERRQRHQPYCGTMFSTQAFYVV